MNIFFFLSIFIYFLLNNNDKKKSKIERSLITSNYSAGNLTAIALQQTKTTNAHTVSKKKFINQTNTCTRPIASWQLERHL